VEIETQVTQMTKQNSQNENESNLNMERICDIDYLLGESGEKTQVRK